MTLSSRRFAVAEPRSSAAVRAAAALVAGLCALFAAAIAADTLWTVLRLHSPLPYFDEWNSLSLFEDLRTGRQPLSALFSQHNEHRIFFPRLILFSDYLFFRGRGILDLDAIVAIQAAHAALLIRLLRGRSAGPLAKIALGSVVVVLLFSLRQEENFSWGFQVQFVGVFAAATLAFAFVSRAVARRGRGLGHGGALAGAFAMVVVATYCMANGILSALVLVVLVAAARMGWRVVLAAATLAGGLALAYLHGYEPAPGHTPLQVALQHPLTVAHYVAVYLGGMFDPDATLAAGFGCCGLAAAAAVAWRSLTGIDRDPARLALCGIILFTGATALLTALGRVGFGVEQAFASRYVTGSGAFWSAQLLYWWAASADRRWRWPVRGTIGIAAALLMAGAWRAQADAKPGMEDRAFAQAQTTNALLLGLYDPNAFEGVFVHATTVRDLAPVLKDNQISIFAEREARLPGLPVDRAGRMLRPGACAGTFETAAAAPDLGPAGVRVAGTLRAPAAGQVARRVLLVDTRNVVAGFASGVSRSSPTPERWEGYARAAPGETLRAFAVLRGPRLCELGMTAVSRAEAP